MLAALRPGWGGTAPSSTHKGSSRSVHSCHQSSSDDNRYDLSRLVNVGGKHRLPSTVGNPGTRPSNTTSATTNGAVGSKSCSGASRTGRFRFAKLENRRRSEKLYFCGRQMPPWGRSKRRATSRSSAVFPCRRNERSRAIRPPSTMNANYATQGGVTKGTAVHLLSRAQHLSDRIA